jgi:hypothetical protein
VSTTAPSAIETTLSSIAERVRRASELLTLCRDRISRAQSDVDQIVADLDAFEIEAPDDSENDEAL